MGGQRFKDAVVADLGVKRPHSLAKPTAELAAMGRVKPIRDRVGDTQKGDRASQAELPLVVRESWSVNAADVVRAPEAVVKQARPSRKERVRAAAERTDGDTGANDKDETGGLRSAEVFEQVGHARSKPNTGAVGREPPRGSRRSADQLWCPVNESLK